MFTLFTRERGKVPAIAKSVRKAQSRMSGQLDVFAHGQMMLAEGRSMDVVTQFKRITRGEAISGDLPRSAAAAVVVEVADKVLEERHPQPELFAVVTGALGRLAAADTEPRMELADFLMRVLAELGYAPQLEECARCGRPLGETGLGFSPIAGGVTCPDCNASWSVAPKIDARSVKILRVLASGDRDLFFRLRVDEDDLAAIEKALEAQLEHHLDRQLKSIEFARQIRRSRRRAGPKAAE
ncbi:MAG: DNA repair protein RecO [Candidatus Dormibacteraeota bacterium]|nr:DNA repair protein RecO [Candidatus Dormibacteraeota bacterium]